MKRLIYTERVEFEDLTRFKINKKIDPKKAGRELEVLITVAISSRLIFHVAYW